MSAQAVHQPVRLAARHSSRRTSSTTTLCPARSRFRAAVSPEMPPPTTSTSAPVLSPEPPVPAGGPGGRGRGTRGIRGGVRVLQAPCVSRKGGSRICPHFPMTIAEPQTAPIYEMALLWTAVSTAQRATKVSPYDQSRPARLVHPADRFVTLAAASRRHPRLGCWVPPRA